LTLWTLSLSNSSITYFIKTGFCFFSNTLIFFVSDYSCYEHADISCQTNEGDNLNPSIVAMTMVSSGTEPMEGQDTEQNIATNTNIGQSLVQKQNIELQYTAYKVAQNDQTNGGNLENFKK